MVVTVEVNPKKGDGGYCSDNSHCKDGDICCTNHEKSEFGYIVNQCQTPTKPDYLGVKWCPNDPLYNPVIGNAVTGFVQDVGESVETAAKEIVASPVVKNTMKWASKAVSDLGNGITTAWKSTTKSLSSGKR